MWFSCILTIECEPGIPLSYYYERIPGYVRGKPWVITEKGKAEWGDRYAGRWKHRKLCACLTRKEFDTLLENLDLRYQAESMGMLGAPMPDGQMELGMIPAWVWSAGYSDEHIDLYACPVPNVEFKEGRECLIDVFVSTYCTRGG